MEKIKKMKDKGIEMFGLFEENKQIGFVAIEKTGGTPELRPLI
ncbi:hypothetical protein [Desulfosporosinus fructosivorans]